MGSTFLWIIAVVSAAYSVFGLALYFMQSALLYGPVRAIQYTPGGLGLDFEDVTFKSKDGLQLSGWYVPAKNSDFTVLFCHGNGGNIMYNLDGVNLFYDMGLSCFIFDYRGYGSSEGTPSEEGTYIDGMAAYKWLTEEKKIPAGNIIIFGRSMGGSIAAYLASQAECASLVIESGFTSYADIGEKFYPYLPVRMFAKFNYSTVDYAKKVHCPLMIIHSREDDIVPFELGQKLYKAANEPKKFVEIFGGHNDGFLVSAEIYNEAWAEWLRFVRGQKGKAAQPRISRIF
jgi:hypothetical protein